MLLILKTYSVDSIKALKCIYPYLPWLLNAYWYLRIFVCALIEKKYWQKCVELWIMNVTTTYFIGIKKLVKYLVDSKFPAFYHSNLNFETLYQFLHDLFVCLQFLRGENNKKNSWAKSFSFLSWFEKKM